MALTSDGRDANIQVQPRLPSLVEIKGPGFVEPPRWLRIDTPTVKKGKGDRLFGFEIYDRIARHVNDLISLS